MPAAKKILVWKGSKALQQQPESPQLNDSKDGPQWVYTYAGPYAACLASRPKRLSTFKGAPAGFFVDQVRLQKQPGGRGLLTVTLSTAPVEDSATFAANPTPIYETEWVEIQKALETHPKYSAGDDALSDDDLNDIEAWKNERDIEVRKSYQYRKANAPLPVEGEDDDPDNYVTLSDAASSFASKVLRGQDSYVLYVPLVRMTVKSKSRPLSTRCGFRDRPPAAAAINGYVYLRTADRCTRQDGWWTRVIEWQGSDYIDPDIYTT